MHRMSRKTKPRASRATPPRIPVDEWREANFEARREAKLLAAAGISPDDKTPHPEFPHLFVSTPEWIIEGCRERARKPAGMIWEDD